MATNLYDPAVKLDELALIAVANTRMYLDLLLLIPF